MKFQSRGIKSFCQIDNIESYTLSYNKRFISLGVAHKKVIYTLNNIFYTLTIIPNKNAFVVE